MGKHVSSKVVPVRLPNELAERVDAEAEASDMSRNEFLVRRIKASFRRADDSRKVVESAHNPEEIRPLEED